MTERISLVDIAKGLSISLVAFGHSHLIELMGDLNQFLGVFRLPFFFFLSGLFFNPAKPFIVTCLSKADSLLKPYVVTLVLLGLAQFAFGGRSYLGQYTGILWGNDSTIQWPPLWFLPHLWLIFVYAFAFSRLSSWLGLSVLSQTYLQSIALVIGIVGLSEFANLPISFLVYRSHTVGLPFSADIVFISGFYFFCGYALKRHVLDFKPNAVIVAVAAMVFVLATVVFDAYLNFSTRQYTPAIGTTVAAIAGIYLSLALSYILQAACLTKRAFSRLGFMSLFILIFHSFVETNVYDALVRFTGNGGILDAGVAFAASIGVPLGVGYVVRKNRLLSLLYLPLGGNPISNKLTTALMRRGT